MLHDNSDHRAGRGDWHRADVHQTAFPPCTSETNVVDGCRSGWECDITALALQDVEVWTLLQRHDQSCSVDCPTFLRQRTCTVTYVTIVRTPCLPSSGKNSQGSTYTYWDAAAESLYTTSTLGEGEPS